MDEVNETGEEILITKCGKPVERLVPARQSGFQMWGRYRDEIQIIGDILSPVTPAGERDAIGNQDRVVDPGDCSAQ